MITNEEKISILIDRLNTLEFVINSFISHAEDFKGKYSLEDELLVCNSNKNILLGMLEDLGGSRSTP